MIVARRWSCRIVGLYSHRVIELDFCRFFTQQGAEAFCARLNDQVPPTMERVTKVEAYYRPWSGAELWVAVVVVAGAAAGAVVGTLAFITRW